MYVLRIAPTATRIGMKTAGSVPKTKSRMTSAPMPPTTASSRTLELPPPPWLLASSSGSCPVTLTVTLAGSPRAAATRIFLAPLVESNFGDPAG